MGRDRGSAHRAVAQLRRATHIPLRFELLGPSIGYSGTSSGLGKDGCRRHVILLRNLTRRWSVPRIWTKLGFGCDTRVWPGLGGAPACRSKRPSSPGRLPLRAPDSPIGGPTGRAQARSVPLAPFDFDVSDAQFGTVRRLFLSIFCALQRE
jgi:hypothetical protein